jgi:hypothetical protein
LSYYSCFKLHSKDFNLVLNILFQGQQGIKGSTGQQGPVGAQGVTGATGKEGPKGEIGPVVSLCFILPSETNYVNIYFFN